jgi:hypothetical protein
MGGLSHYLQSRTKSTPFKMNHNAILVPTQSTTDKRDEPEPQSPSQQVDDEWWGEPQYFSNTLSVLPADRHGSYYIIYHRNASGECRDDIDEATSSRAFTNGTRREYDVGRRQDFFEADLVANHSMMDMETKPKRIDDEDYDDDDAGFVSFAAGAFIPVLHFIQFFMC